MYMDHGAVDGRPVRSTVGWIVGRALVYRAEFGAGRH
jgi:hypothetical protein